MTGRLKIWERVVVCCGFIEGRSACCVMRRQHTRCPPPALEKKLPRQGVAGDLGRAFHRLAPRAAIKGGGVLFAEKR